MRDVMDRVGEWQGQGKQVALATVVKTWGSAPRPVGSKLALTAEGDLVGSVSGGCVETAVLESGLQVLASGEPRLLRFGVTDDQAWAVGLSCGGEIEVYVESLVPAPGDSAAAPIAGEVRRQLVACLADNELVVLATIVEGRGQGRHLLIWPRGETLGDLGSPRLNQRVALYAEQVIAGGRSGRKTFRWDEDEVDAFVEIYSPSPELIVVGAVHVAVPLVQFASTLGFKTIVVDPREVFATRERFDTADHVAVGWPEQVLPHIGLHGGSYVAVLTHDIKIDIPALELALRSPARYIGILGSKKTHARRVAALLERGFEETDLARIHSPIGLDLGGRRANEIAVSIIAEMVAVMNGRATPDSRGG